MFVGDFQSKSIPVHKLFQYSGGSKKYTWQNWWFSAYDLIGH